MIKIYKNYKEFLYREDKTINGVSQRFLDEQSITLDTINLINCTGCWNCRECRNCIDCRNCSICRYCRDCEYCSECNDCINCNDCYYCNLCWDCVGCVHCYRRTNGINCNDYEEPEEF